MQEKSKKHYSIRDIDFSEQTICQNLNSFYHFGVSWEDHYHKIHVIEKALNIIHDKLVDGLDGQTHGHKRYMAFTYLKLIQMLGGEMRCGSSIGYDYYNECVEELYERELNRLKSLIDPIIEILKIKEFTHRDHNLLFRAYLHELKEQGKLSKFYISIRNKVENILLTSLNRLIKDKPSLKRLVKNKEHLLSHLEEKIKKICGEKDESE